MTFEVFVKFHVLILIFDKNYQFESTLKSQKVLSERLPPQKILGVQFFLKKYFMEKSWSVTEKFIF